MTNIATSIKEETAIQLLEKIKNEKERLLKAKLILKPIEQPKIDESEIPFAIPENWIWVRLNEVSIIQEGPGIRKHQYQKDGVQFLTVTNILDGEVDLEKSKKYISTAEYNSKYTHFKINKGDIVNACSGATWGKSAIYMADELLILNTSTLRLRFFGDLANNKYLYYLTKTDFFKNQILAQLTGQQPNFGVSHYSKVVIPFPPLSTQNSIVEMLDKSNDIISTAKELTIKKLNGLEELRKSFFYGAFSGSIENI